MSDGCQNYDKGQRTVIRVKPKPETIKAIVQTFHYTEDDPECIGDYHSVELVIQTTKTTYRFKWGDDYHDKGADKADGVLTAFQELLGFKPTIFRLENKADIEAEGDCDD